MVEHEIRRAFHEQLGGIKRGAQLPARVRGLVAAMSEEAERLFRLAVAAYAEGDADLAAALDDIDERLDQLHADSIAAIIAGAARTHSPPADLAREADGS